MSSNMRLSLCTFLRLKPKAATRPFLSVFIWSGGFPHTHSALWQAHSSNHGSSGIYWTPQRQAAGPPGALWDISGLQPIDKLPPLTDGEQIYTSVSAGFARSPLFTSFCCWLSWLEQLGSVMGEIWFMSGWLIKPSILHINNILLDRLLFFLIYFYIFPEFSQIITGKLQH